MPKHKTYVTFGIGHKHIIDGKVFDKDTVAIIESDGAREGRTIAFELFGPKWCMEYPELYWDESKMEYFPKGYVHV